MASNKPTMSRSILLSYLEMLMDLEVQIMTLEELIIKDRLVYNSLGHHKKPDNAPLRQKAVEPSYMDEDSPSPTAMIVFGVIAFISICWLYAINYTWVNDAGTMVFLLAAGSVILFFISLYNYRTKMKEYESAVAVNKSRRRDRDRLQDGYDRTYADNLSEYRKSMREYNKKMYADNLKKQYLDKQMKNAQKKSDALKALRDRAYNSLNIIHTSYRSYEALVYMYNAFSTHKCSTMKEAMKMVDSEAHWNKLHSSISNLSAQISQIISNQNKLNRVMTSASASLSQIMYSNREIESKLNTVAENTYNTNTALYNGFNTVAANLSQIDASIIRNGAEARYYNELAQKQSEYQSRMLYYHNRANNNISFWRNNTPP